MKSAASRAARSGTAGPESTRYLAISRDLARDIYGGKYPVGSLLPPETSLSEIYGASRQTIREAMRIIGGMGLIARQRGVGTTVLAATPLPAFTQSVASLAELQQYAEETQLRSERIEHVVARGELAEKLGCPEDKIWLRSEGWRIVATASRRCAGPKCISTTPSRRSRRICATPPACCSAIWRAASGWCCARCARRSARSRCRPRSRRGCAWPSARPRCASSGAYFAHAADPVEIAISIHPGDRFSYSMTLASTAR